jgi:hypothetical protein
LYHIAALLSNIFRANAPAYAKKFPKSIDFYFKIGYNTLALCKMLDFALSASVAQPVEQLIRNQ